MKLQMPPRCDKSILSEDGAAFEIRSATFVGPKGLQETHVMLQPNMVGDFAEQLAALTEAYADALQQLGLDADTAVLRRFFCSDPANQQSILEAHPLADVEAPCAVSFVGQPPLPRGKVALWAYHVALPNGGVIQKRRCGGNLDLQRGELTHTWSTNLARPDLKNSYTQTEGIFADYVCFLESRKMRLDLNVVRTWLYARDVDTTYAGLVDARRELFIEQGLTAETHYIASTGIEGRSAETAVKVSMDSYAVAGLRSEQVQFLEALDHLGPTIMYGVSFERGTAIRYQDRQHIFISGTASIDPMGIILNLGNVMKQLDRVIENIESLLKDVAAGLEDIASLIVYLRDPDDAERVTAEMKRRFPEAPMVVVWGPVCRPGWLVEIEAIAVSSYSDPALPEY